ncbi:hypothetical protein ABZ746_30955 [Streptomyces sp. NPDC020096]
MGGRRTGVPDPDRPLGTGRGYDGEPLGRLWLTSRNAKSGVLVEGSPLSLPPAHTKQRRDGYRSWVGEEEQRS